MNWTKEELGQIFSKIFALDLEDLELEQIWDQAKGREVTPLGDHMNIAVSPAQARYLIVMAAQRIGAGIKNKRLKKVREEIMPAIDFTLFLKMKGYGEHFILSRDTPDIALVKIENPQKGSKLTALPLEVTFVNDQALANTKGEDTNHKIANVIVSNKFAMKYVLQTMLLVVLDSVSNFDVRIISELLSKKHHYFHIIWFLATIEDDELIIAQLCPELGVEKISREKDFLPILY